MKDNNFKKIEDDFVKSEKDKGAIFFFTIP